MDTLSKKERALLNNLDKIYERLLNQEKEYAELTGLHAGYDSLLYNGIEELDGDSWAKAAYGAGYRAIANELFYLQTVRSVKLVEKIMNYWWCERMEKLIKTEGILAKRDFTKKQQEYFSKQHATINSK